MKGKGQKEVRTEKWGMGRGGEREKGQGREGEECRKGGGVGRRRWEEGRKGVGAGEEEGEGKDR